MIIKSSIWRFCNLISQSDLPDQADADLIRCWFLTIQSSWAELWIHVDGGYIACNLQQSTHEWTINSVYLPILAAPASRCGLERHHV